MLNSIHPKIVELGKIKIGRKEAQVRKSKSGGTWRAPEKIDHFILTTLDRDGDGNLEVDRPLMESLLRTSGTPQLKELPIALLSDNIDEILLARHCLYSGAKLHATCDESACAWFVDRDGKSLPEPQRRPCNGEHVAKPWKLHATLNVVIASGGSRFGGVHKFRTTSANTTSQLYGGMLQIAKLTGGLLQGLPLRLVLRPKKVTPAELGGKSTTIYVAHIEMRGNDLAEIQKQAATLASFRAQHAREMAAANAEYTRLLHAPGDRETVVEQSAVAAEFHPAPLDSEERFESPPHDPITGEVVDESMPDDEKRAVEAKEECLAMIEACGADAIEAIQGRIPLIARVLGAKAVNEIRAAYKAKTDAAEKTAVVP